MSRTSWQPVGRVEFPRPYRRALTRPAGRSERRAAGADEHAGSGGEGVAAVVQGVDQAVGDQGVQGAFALDRV